MASTAFSTTDAAIIAHTVELDSDAVQATAAHTGKGIEAVYDVVCTAEQLLFDGSELIAPPFQRVALQFPDEALSDSVPLFYALNRELARICAEHDLVPPRLYILADTSYGSCCVDEVAAAHVQADVVVHYGHACLSRTAKIPALYTFPKYDVDVGAAVHGLLDAARFFTESRAILLTYDVAYAHAIESIYTTLQAQWPWPNVPLILSRADTQCNYRDRLAARRTAFQGTAPAAPHKSALSTSLLGASRQFTLPSGVQLSDTAALYVGCESRALTHLLLALGSQYPVASYDPQTKRVRTETGKTNRLLMRRYATIQKARDASVVALVVGTLGVHAYLPLLKELRRILTSPVSRRKVYTISVGKLNPAKLANFQEIDAFVLVACPENSLLDTKEFMRPIITPWEMMLAVQAHGGREVVWTGDYELNLDAVVHDALRADTQRSDDDTPHFSFATGTYVSRTRYGSAQNTHDDTAPLSHALARIDVAPHELAVRDPKSGKLLKVLDSASLAHSQHRTWHGLDSEEGADRPVAILEQGTAGFAQRYRAAEDQAPGAGEASL
ncbi:Diphthamide biosynthesis protein 2 [Malassezia vespertilionis]|uniref:2-(3-amino-3-carboxypropyl)histidine synthase subunit 2 n=1 Tax=Malassezia vespertilionis TaxID=2020962 RepID=A0A2N1JA57_9BASI|nr:Diphthamide biosynthesis protein 2 [Malassezia vespertilionis]PKI83436.1 Dph2p [Malassezia vespertilionis]WFD07292.1 Diphthamide biosynthesis protein 2 [Malassezia vespertilionis]